jgi:hypothetical protein
MVSKVDVESGHLDHVFPSGARCVQGRLDILKGGPDRGLISFWGALPVEGNGTDNTGDEDEVPGSDGG